MSENTKTAIHVISYDAEFLWNALEKLTNEYSQEELEDVFKVKTIGDLVSDWDPEAFCKRFREYDKEREKIQVGDEVLWERPTGYNIETPNGVTVTQREELTGVVLYIDDTRKEYVILTYCNHFRGLYKERVSMSDKTIRKTYTHFAIRSDER